MVWLLKKRKIKVSRAKNKKMKQYINSLSELKNVFDELLLKDAIFRGVNEESQKLPKLIRGKDYSNKEYEILKMFERYYGLYSTANNCWEFIALAQHCGLMTRLIDFTTNPYVALFFALHNKKNDDNEYIVYSLDKKDLKMIYGAVINEPKFNSETGMLTIESILFDIDTPFCDILNKEFKKLKNKTGIHTIRPNYRNQRMLMQQGLFVVPNKVNELSIKQKIYDSASIFVINENIRDEAIKYLEKLGYDEFHLMPDLDSICNEINHCIVNDIK